MMTLSSIAELLSSESGHHVLWRRMEAAKAQIDGLAIEAKGIPLVHNMQNWTQAEALPIIVAGVNKFEQGETKEYWRPYND